MDSDNNDNRSHCPNISIFCQYLYGEISEEENLNISKHIKSCPFCEDELNEIISFVGNNPQSEIDQYYSTHNYDDSSLSEFQSIFDFKKFFKMFLGKLNSLKTLEGFSIETFNFEGVRGHKDEIETYTIGDAIYLNIEISKGFNGYLTIIKYNDESHFQIIYPKTPRDNIFLAGDKKKVIEFTAGYPVGTNYLMAVLTSDRLIDHRLLDFDNLDLFSLLEDLNKKIIPLKVVGIQKDVISIVINS